MAKFKTHNDPVLENMKEEATLFIREMEDLKNKPRWLTFYGGSGTGKSYLSKLMYDRFHSHLYKIYDEDQYPIFREGRFYPSYMIANMAREQADMNEPSCFDLVVIDDLGAEYVADSGFITAKWIELFDRRMGKWTIINTNMSLDEIAEKYDRRISSRMIRDGNVAVDCSTMDYSLRKEEE